MDLKTKRFNYKKVLPVFGGREFLFSMRGNEFGEGKNEILIGEFEIGKGESRVLIGEFEIGKGESQVLIGEFEIGKGESRVLIGEFEIGKGESRVLIGEFEILQVRMLIFCLFLRFLLFRMNFEVKISFTF
jgi:hypothetical protein